MRIVLVVGWKWFAHGDKRSFSSQCDIGDFALSSVSVIAARALTGEILLQFQTSLDSEVSCFGLSKSAK